MTQNLSELNSSINLTENKWQQEMIISNDENLVESLNTWIDKKIDVLKQLKANPLIIFKLKDDLFKTIDVYLKNLLKSINEEKTDLWFEENTYKHLYWIATNEYFEKLWEIIIKSQYFYDQLFYYYFIKIKIGENDHIWHSKLVKLYNKIFSICKITTPNNNSIEDENVYSDFTEEFLALDIRSQQFVTICSEKDFYKKIRYIVHNILKRILYEDKTNCYKDALDNILYELYSIFKLDLTVVSRFLKNNPNEFTHIHKKLNESIIWLDKKDLLNKLNIVDGWILIQKIHKKILEYWIINKNWARNFYAEVYMNIKQYKEMWIIDSELKNKIFEYISSEIILKYYKKDLAIISVDLKDMNFKEKVISYVDWSKHSTYFNLKLINKQDSINIVTLKETIVSILKHHLSHLIYPILLYKLRKSIKISFKEFLYIEHLTNIVFSENYEEYKIMFRFNKDLKNLLFNNNDKAFFHLSKWISWIILIMMCLYWLVYVFWFPVYFVVLLFLYLYIYFKDEFFVELNLSWIKYYLWILITIVFVLNWWLSTNKYEQWLKNIYTNFNNTNGDIVFYNSIKKTWELVVDWSKKVADILQK